MSAATAYDVVDDLWVITPYFNPLGYRSKQRNYAQFRSRLDAAQAVALVCLHGACPRR